jgi:glutamate:GABA antiporter
MMLIVTSVGSIRNLASTALFGPALIFFYVFGALIFLIPTAFVSAELSGSLKEEGGIYHWVRKAFGEKWAMVAIWLQWVNTMIWCPSILAFISGVAAYFVHPHLAENKSFLVAGILTIFWSLTLLNLFGMHLSARVSAFCGTVGTLVPIALLILLGLIWIGIGKPLQISISPAEILHPKAQYWTSLVAIAASFLGIELAGVHVSDVRNPHKNVPKAILLSSIIVLTAMLFGSLTIAAILPLHELNLVSGSMQAMDHFFKRFHLEMITPLVTVLIIVGSIGGLINWVISPAKGLLHAAEFGFLPPFLRKTNRKGIAMPILIIQALVVTVLCLLFQFVPSINSFYWFLTALSTELYMVMYLLMFLSAIRLRHQKKEKDIAFRIPGKHIGFWLTVGLGLFGCSLIIIVSFFLPPHIEMGGGGRYALLITGGNLITLLPLHFFFRYKYKNSLLIKDNTL